MKIIEPIVRNSLLRVEGTRGKPPRGWEKPSDKHNFWVLEITGLETPLSTWKDEVEKILEVQDNSLSDFKQKRYRMFLFVETDRSLAPARFPSAFLEKLAAHSISLEYYSPE